MAMMPFDLATSNEKHGTRGLSRRPVQLTRGPENPPVRSVGQAAVTQKDRPTIAFTIQR